MCVTAIASNVNSVPAHHVQKGGEDTDISGGKVLKTTEIVLM